MNLSTPQIFIGYDERQPNAFKVCKQSIIDNASGPVDIYPLDHRDLRRKNLFWREWGININDGGYYDKLDGLPFSNQFSHTRFLVPFYSKYLGIESGLSMFVDLDFVFFEDVYELFKECTGDYEVFCVKHDFTPSETVKMDDRLQTSYPKKLWSSLMLFDVKKASKRLTLDYVNTAKSSDLHRFNWIDENLVGSLSEAWNFIPEHSELNIDHIKAIHYTAGLPNIPGYETCKYSKYYIDLERRVK